jgi:hypothetical protein
VSPCLATTQDRRLVKARPDGKPHGFTYAECRTYSYTKAQSVIPE